MEYSLMSGGKRLRPILLMAAADAVKVNGEKFLTAASAIEMIHTYSLVHDDLPAMDNDDYRRNQLTVHKKFSEDIAILAGDALLTQAFVLASTEDYPKDVIHELSLASGANGMIYGQELDLKYENQEIELKELLKVHNHKTGDLLAVPLKLAVLLADKSEYLEKMDEAGHDLGLAFQIQDDILDVTKNLKKAGEESSDIKNHKNTYLKFYDIETAKKHADAYYTKVIEAISSLPLQSQDCIEFLKSLIQREI